jgi:hypothetical protein
MARSGVIPLGNYAPGSYDWGPFNVPANVESYIFTIQRCTSADPTIWPSSGVHIEFRQEISEDDGQTWRGFGGFGDEGGIRLGRDGNEQQETLISGPFPRGDRIRVRGNITISGGVLRSFASVVVE